MALLSTIRLQATLMATHCVVAWVQISLDGGAGFDFVSYADSTTAITASLTTPASNTVKLPAMSTTQSRGYVEVISATR